MNSDFESAKTYLHKANELVDIKNNPVVNSMLIAPLKSIPIVGDLIDSSTNTLLENHQKEKEQQLLNIILSGKDIITTEMVNDIEFIINFNKVLESVKRLATNDKVNFFGNLIKNGYLSGDHIDSNLFEEYLNILNTMSFREIKYLTDYKLYCEEISKNKKGNSNNNVNYNKWGIFSRDYSKKNKISINELCSAFMRIKQTGFIDEVLETESGDVDEDNYSFNSLGIESNGFYIEKCFLKFYDMVLNMQEL